MAAPSPAARCCSATSIYKWRCPHKVPLCMTLLADWEQVQGAGTRSQKQGHGREIRIGHGNKVRAWEQGQGNKDRAW